MRPETGPMEFEGDWCGVFIRGDNAAHYAYLLDHVLDNIESEDRLALDFTIVAVLRGLVNTLQMSISHEEYRDGVQNMRPFSDCSKEAITDSIINR